MQKMSVLPFWLQIHFFIVILWRIWFFYCFLDDKSIFFLQKLGSIEDFDVKITVKYRYRGYVSVRHPYLLIVLCTCCDLQVITTNLKVVIEILSVLKIAHWENQTKLSIKYLNCVLLMFLIKMSMKINHITQP